MVKIFSILFCFFLSACVAVDKKAAQESPLESLTVKDGQVYYYLRHAEKNFKVMFLADTHFTIEDERGKDFYSFTQRMGEVPLNLKTMEKVTGGNRLYWDL